MSREELEALRRQLADAQATMQRQEAELAQAVSLAQAAQARAQQVPRALLPVPSSCGWLQHKIVLGAMLSWRRRSPRPRLPRHRAQQVPLSAARNESVHEM